MHDDSPVSRLPLVAMGVIMALAVLVAIGLGLRGPAEYAQGTPEAALQDFLEAGLAGQRDELIAHLVPDKRAACDDQIEPASSIYPITDLGFELDHIDVDGDQAIASVTNRWDSGGDPFGGSARHATNTVELHHVDGYWFVDDASWPWWIDRCLDEPQ